MQPGMLSFSHLDTSTSFRIPCISIPHQLIFQLDTCTKFIEMWCVVMTLCG